MDKMYGKDTVFSRNGFVPILFFNETTKPMTAQTKEKNSPKHIKPIVLGLPFQFSHSTP